MKKLVIILAGILVLFPQGCKKEEPIPEEEKERLMLIDWIWEGMNEVYLWYDEIDQSLYPPVEGTDPEDFFYSILVDQDRNSFISDNIDELVASFNNVSLSSGISPWFARISDSDDVVILVEYVVPGSPADQAGIERGDIITTINETTINIDNYIDLFYSENLKMGFADYTEQGLVPSSRVVEITATVIEENPVLHYEVIDYEGKNVGYLVYNGFSAGDGNKWVDSLETVLSTFDNENIDDLVIDLRYNRGGRPDIANHLASSICPSNIPGQGFVFVNYQWNDILQEYYENNREDYADRLEVIFEESVLHSLNLTNVYFLTTAHSASASELLIIGLDPYMNVTTIGESTYGKCYGSYTIGDYEDPPRHNWAMQPLVFKFANADGFTDFVNGLQPDFYVEDNLLDGTDFGDLSDPMLAKALEEITGVAPTVKKTLRKPLDIETLPDPVRMRKDALVFESDLGR